MKYLSDDNSESSDHNKLLRKLGSFWLEFLEDPEQARGLLAAASQTNLINKFQNGLQQLVSSSGNYSEFITIRFDELKVIKAQQAGENSLTYLDEKDRIRLTKLDPANNFSLVPYDGNSDGLIRYYIAKKESSAFTIDHKGLQLIGQNFQVHSIETDSGLLLRGVDFYQTETHYVFYNNPKKLFKSGVIYVRSSSSDIQSIYRFPLRQESVPNLENSKFLSRCARFEQSLASFTLALSAISGITINQKKGVVTSAVSDPIKYILDDGRIIDADYQHVSLLENKFYNEDYIIGQGISVHYGGNSGTKWWRNADWSGGLPLFSITDWSTIVIPDGSQKADYYLKTVNGEVKTFLKFEVEGDADEIIKYWDALEASQIKSGKYLADQLGLTTKLNLNLDVYVNPIDILFESTLDCTAIVIEIDDSVVDDTNKSIDYITQEAPAGAVVLVLVKQNVVSQNFGADSAFDVEGDYVRVKPRPVQPPVITPASSSSSVSSSSSQSSSSSDSSSSQSSSKSSSSSSSQSSSKSSSSSSQSSSESSSSSQSSSSSSTSSVSSSKSSSKSSSSSAYSSHSSNSSSSISSSSSNSSGSSSSSISSSSSSGQNLVQGYDECEPYSSKSSESSSSSVSSSKSSSSLSSSKSSSSSSDSSISSSQSSSSSVSSSESSSRSSSSSSQSSSSSSSQSSSSRSSSQSSSSSSSDSSESSSSKSSSSLSSSKSSRSSISSSESSSSKSSSSVSSSSKSSSSKSSSSSQSSSSQSSSDSSSSSNSSSSSATPAGYCGIGFVGNLDIVNGNFTKVIDPVTDEPLEYNDRWYYHNANDVALYFNGTTWVIDLTHDTSIDEDLIELQPDDASIWDPSGYYYPSILGTHQGYIYADLCSSSSSESSRSSASSSSSSSQTPVQGYAECEPYSSKSSKSSESSSSISTSSKSSSSSQSSSKSSSSSVSSSSSKSSSSVSSSKSSSSVSSVSSSSRSSLSSSQSSTSSTSSSSVSSSSSKSSSSVSSSKSSSSLSSSKSSDSTSSKSSISSKSSSSSISSSVSSSKSSSSKSSSSSDSSSSSATPAGYCASGFTEHLSVVNGTFTRVDDVVTGEPFFFNNRWFYQNENFVSLYYNGSTWVIDISGQDGNLDEDLIERPYDQEDVWDPSGCYYPPTLVGSHEGCISSELCSSQSSRSSTSSASSESSSSTLPVQGFNLCPNAVIEYQTGLEKDILVSPAEIGDIFLAQDSQRILIYRGDGVFDVLTNDSGIFSGVDTFENILTQRPVPPVGTLFVAVDTEQILLHTGGSNYAVINTEPLGYYCATGFVGQYEAVNGSYSMVLDPDGKILLYNGYPYYQNKHKITLFFNGIVWAFDLTENNSVDDDFIEKPVGSVTPSGHFYVSGHSSNFGTVIEGLCQEGSSSSSGLPITTVFSGGTITVPQSATKSMKLTLPTGGYVTVAVDGGSSTDTHNFRITALSGAILSVDTHGLFGGPFFVSEANSIRVDVDGKHLYVNYLRKEDNSFILVISGIKFIVYQAA